MSFNFKHGARELTVAGDSQEYGRVIWIAQQETNRSRIIHFIDIESGKIVQNDQSEDIILIIDKDITFTVCGPHIIEQWPVEKYSGIHFWRIEFNGEYWSLKKLYIKFPQELLDDVQVGSFVDVNVIAETQVLFLWRKNGTYSNPQAILRDYIVN